MMEKKEYMLQVSENRYGELENFIMNNPLLGDR